MEQKQNARDNTCGFVDCVLDKAKFCKWSFLELHNTQPGQVSAAALGMARAIAYSSFIEKKEKK